MQALPCISLSSKVIGPQTFCGAKALRASFAALTEEWDRIVAINLRGVMLCYRYAALQMIKQGRGGRIIGRPTHLLRFSDPVR